MGMKEEFYRSNDEFNCYGWAVLDNGNFQVFRNIWLTLRLYVEEEKFSKETNDEQNFRDKIFFFQSEHFSSQFSSQVLFTFK